MEQERRNGSYRHLRVRVGNTPGAQQAIVRLFDGVPERDARCVPAGDEVRIQLRQLDMEAFKSAAARVSASVDVAIQSKVTEVVESIHGIRSYAQKGRMRVFAGYNDERRVANRKQKEEMRGKYFYANAARFSKVNVQLPREFHNQILNGDSEEVLKRLPDNCVDLVFTSPPYNFGLGYDQHEDGTQWEAYFEKLNAILKECVRVLKYGGRLAINVQPLFSDYIPIHHLVSQFLMDLGLIWKGEILWEKHNYNCKYTAWGSWCSPSNPYLKYTWEFIEVFCKGTLKHEGRSEDADISGDEFKRWVYAKWEVAPETGMSKYGHPAMFPEALVERVLKLFAYRNDVVLDPFCGAGTTAVVAKRLGRVYLGVDVSERYCDTARDRIRQVHPQLEV